MAIYLDQQTRPYLERLIKKQLLNERDFIAKRIQKILEQDKERLEKIASCEHTYGEYKGYRECCTKCETKDIGMHESWELISKTKNK